MTKNGKKQYPEWQTVIREAQARKKIEDEQRALAELQRRNVAEMKKRAEDAAHLKEVLGYLGIEIQPERDRINIGGYCFILSNYKRKFVVVGTPDKGPKNAEKLEFRLAVIPAMEDYDHWFEDEPEVGLVSDRVDDPDYDWFVERAGLADKLDELDRLIEQGRRFETEEEMFDE